MKPNYQIYFGLGILTWVILLAKVEEKKLCMICHKTFYW